MKERPSHRKSSNGLKLISSEWQTCESGSTTPQCWIPSAGNGKRNGGICSDDGGLRRPRGVPRMLSGERWGFEIDVAGAEEGGFPPGMVSAGRLALHVVASLLLPRPRIASQP